MAEKAKNEQVPEKGTQGEEPVDPKVRQLGNTTPPKVADMRPEDWGSAPSPRIRRR